MSTSLFAPYRGPRGYIGIDVARPDDAWRSIERLACALDEADAVIVGAGAGLSTAAGFTYDGERFEHWFSDFHRTYGFSDMYSGGFYPYATPERYWAFWSRYIYCNRYDLPENPLYRTLINLLSCYDYFVLTTNVDHQFQLAGIERHRLFYTQGDYGLFQCSVPCHKRTYDNEGAVRAMLDAQHDLQIPSDLIPRCPRCGSPMAMNLRSDGTFVEDDSWHRAEMRYREFLRRHEHLRVLFLELGVGGNTPAIIKFPFWNMTAANPRATYACINNGEAYTPRELAAQSILIDSDIAPAVDALAHRSGIPR